MAEGVGLFALLLLVLVFAHTFLKLSWALVPAQLLPGAAWRGSLFALAMQTWLLGARTFLLATTGMVLMLLCQRFGSAIAAATRCSHAVLAGALPVSREKTCSATNLDGQSVTFATGRQP